MSIRYLDALRAANARCAAAVHIYNTTRHAYFVRDTPELAPGNHHGIALGIAYRAASDEMHHALDARADLLRKEAVRIVSILTLLREGKHTSALAVLADTEDILYEDEEIDDGYGHEWRSDHG